MASHQHIQISFWEKLGLLGTIGSIGMSLCKSMAHIGYQLTDDPLVTRIFLSISRRAPLMWTAGWSFKRVVAAAFSRNISFLSMRQRRYLFPATGETVHAFCSGHQLQCSCTTIDCGDTPSAMLHDIQLNSSEEVHEKALIYLPGGGYVNSLFGSGQLEFVLTCARAAKVRRFICLETTLAPELKYPGQMIQFVVAIRYLLEERYIKPANIILLGESAGANLALALLAHTMTPKDGIPRLAGLSKAKGQQLRALALINPFISMSYSAKSFQENAHLDMITADSVQFFVENWQPAHEIWAEPILATGDFWRTLPVQKVLISAGTLESFRDDILQFSTMLSTAVDDCTVVTGEKEIHCQCAIDSAMALPPSGSAIEVLAWMKSL